MSDTLSKSSLKTSNCEEIWQRYRIFLEERNHRNELNYCCETSKYNSTSFASSKHIISHQQEGLSRYFQCFYDSFSHLEEKKANELLDCVEKVEADLRCAITQMEKECVAVICRSMAPFLYKCMPSLLLINLLHPADAEYVSRSLIYFDYYQMLLEAATVQEIISRRNIIFSVEPQSRQKIENIEPYEWIAARQRQVNREEAVRTGQNTQDFEKTLDYLRWCEQRQKQLFFFEQSEVEERMDVERLERLHAGLIFELFLSNFREIRYNQCTYTKWKCKLNQEDVKHLSKEEFSARSAVMYYQFESFKLIGGLEVRHFLKTRRNTLVNERVEIPLCGRGQRENFLGVNCCSMSNMKAALRGVSAERGFLLHCRDPSSFEIVVRINQQLGGQNIKLVLRTKSGISDYSNCTKSVFVSDIAPFLESIYSWLNPISKRDSALLRKRIK